MLLLPHCRAPSRLLIPHDYMTLHSYNFLSMRVSNTPCVHTTIEASGELLVNQMERLVDYKLVFEIRREFWRMKIKHQHILRNICLCARQYFSLSVFVMTDQLETFVRNIPDLFLFELVQLPVVLQKVTGFINSI